MTALSIDWTEEIVRAAGTNIQLIKGGSGEPLLILHDEIAHSGPLRFHQALAQNHTVYIPSHPGFGKSDRLDWIMNMRDLAGWYLMALDEIGLGPVNTIGLSLGGWLAAEMATMCPQQFKKLALVAPMGVKPPQGDIYDMFLVVVKEFITASFLNPGPHPRISGSVSGNAGAGTNSGVGSSPGGGLPIGVETLYVLSGPAPVAAAAQ